MVFFVYLKFLNLREQLEIFFQKLKIFNFQGQIHSEIMQQKEVLTLGCCIGWKGFFEGS